MRWPNARYRHRRAGHRRTRADALARLEARSARESLTNHLVVVEQRLPARRRRGKRRGERRVVAEVRDLVAVRILRVEERVVFVVRNGVVVMDRLERWIELVERGTDLPDRGGRIRRAEELDGRLQVDEVLTELRVVGGRDAAACSEQDAAEDDPHRSAHRSSVHSARWPNACTTPPAGGCTCRSSA